MANNSTANPGAAGDTFTTTDLTTFTAHSATAKLPGTLLYTAVDTTTAPTSVTSANPLPTLLRSEIVDDAAFTPATSRVTMVGATFDDVTPDSVNEGDGGAVRMSANRCLYVNLRDNAGNERGLNIDASGNLTANITGTVTVGSHAVTNAGTFAVQASIDAGQTLATVTTVGTVTTVSTVTNVATIGTSVTPGGGAAHLGKAEDAAHTTGDTGVMMLGVRMATATDLSVGATDGDYEPLQVDASGRLHVNVGNTVTVGSHAVTNAGTFAVQAVCTNAGTFAVQATCTNAGTFAVQVDGAALTALQLIDNSILVDDAAFTPATSSVTMAGFEADETATDSVDEGDAGAARMTLDRKQIVTVQPHTAGGLTIFRSLDIDETEEDVKTSAGQVYGWYIFNATASIVYVKFYNATAATVVVGTTTPVMTLPIPAATSGGVGFTMQTVEGIAFDTAICVAATTGLADNDVGAPAANAVIIQVFYK